MCQVSHVVDSLAQGGQRLPGLLQFVESYLILMADTSRFVLSSAIDIT